MFLFSQPYQRQILALAPGKSGLQSTKHHSLTSYFLIFILAYLIMICGGMFLCYGVFNIFIGYQTWTVGISTPAMFLIAGSFHIAVIVGVIPAAFVYKLVDVKLIHVSFSFLMEMKLNDKIFRQSIQFLWQSDQLFLSSFRDCMLEL